MAELILHHYLSSPFSEKARLILGYKKLAWKSVLVPRHSPKPDVVALTGGYRKTPVLQVGADIYCDTALIADVLEHIQPSPTIYPEPRKGIARILAQWADTTLFWSAVKHDLGPQGAVTKFGGAAPEVARAILEDRKAMGIDLSGINPADSSAAYKSYLGWLSDMLQWQSYLLGGAPCIADFSAYHALWLVQVRTQPAVDLLAQLPDLAAWVERMRAIGHGSFETITASQAITTAAACEPAPAGHGLLRDSNFQDEHGIALGSRVSVAADHFGLEPSEGELIAATRTHYSLRRTDPRAGTVHVHFPRIGYVLRALAL